MAASRTILLRGQTAYRSNTGLPSSPRTPQPLQTSGQQRDKGSSSRPKPVVAKVKIVSSSTRLTIPPSKIPKVKTVAPHHGSRLPSTTKHPRTTVAQASSAQGAGSQEYASLTIGDVAGSLLKDVMAPFKGSLSEREEHSAQLLKLEKYVVPITNRRQSVSTSALADLHSSQGRYERTRARLKQYILSPSNSAFRHIDTIVKKLKASIDIIPQELEVLLIDRSRIPTWESTALTTGGNKVFIMTNLSDVAQTAPQKAFVICHEIAHCLARHSLERTLLCERGGYEHGSKRDMYIGREQEFEADMIGRELALRAGYGPEAGIAWLERVRMKNGEGQSSTGPEYATHPTSTERILALRQGGRRISL